MALTHMAVGTANGPDALFRGLDDSGNMLFQLNPTCEDSKQHRALLMEEQQNIRVANFERQQAALQAKNDSLKQQISDRKQLKALQQENASLQAELDALSCDDSKDE